MPLGFRRSALFGVHASTLETFTASTTVGPTKHLFGHTGTMMTRANSPRREAGRLFILPGTLNGPYLHTRIPADRPHRAVAGARARRQNSV